jgi:hypothetical protein
MASHQVICTIPCPSTPLSRSVFAELLPPASLPSWQRKSCLPLLKWRSQKGRSEHFTCRLRLNTGRFATGRNFGGGQAVFPLNGGESSGYPFSNARLLSE